MNPLSRNNPLWKRICVILGSCLLLAALGLTLGNLWEQRQAEQNSAHLLALAQQRLDGENPQPGDDPLNPDPLAGYAIDGILSIPDLGLELPVLADYSEENLRLSICLYRQESDGSRKVIAGHNYRNHFGRLASLEEGALLTYTREDGTVTRYQVTGITEIDADDPAALDAGGLGYDPLYLQPGYDPAGAGPAHRSRNLRPLGITQSPQPLLRPGFRPGGGFGVYGSWAGRTLLGDGRRSLGEFGSSPAVPCAIKQPLLGPGFRLAGAGLFMG